MNSRALCLSLLVAFTAGCAPMRYSDYVGQDSSSVFGTWPNSSGTMAERGRAVPVYRGWPDRPYKVLGSVRLQDPGQTWDEGDLAGAARRAKGKGGDAIILRHGSEFGVSQIAGAKNDERSIWASSDTSALVIRWLSKSEIDEQNEALEKLRRNYQLAHPDLTVNRELTTLLFAHLVRAGVDRRSAEFVQRFNQTLAKLSYTETDGFAGDWLFKAVLSGGSAISGEDERDYIGIATLSVNQESVTLVSREGGIEMNFGGTIGNGRLSGQLGLGSHTARCEGVVTLSKISISFQSRSSDGLVRGNIVLQRQLQTTSPNEKTTLNPTGKRT